MCRGGLDHFILSLVMFMMDKEWAEANDVLTPHDVAKGETNFATMNTNGTGAFKLVSRSIDEKTVLPLLVRAARVSPRLRLRRLGYFDPLEAAY